MVIRLRPSGFTLATPRPDYAEIVRFREQKNGDRSPRFAFDRRGGLGPSGGSDLASEVHRHKSDDYTSEEYDNQSE